MPRVMAHRSTQKYSCPQCNDNDVMWTDVVQHNLLVDLIFGATFVSFWLANVFFSRLYFVRSCKVAERLLQAF